MRASTLLALRTIVVLGFVVIMPLLAIFRINRGFDELTWGHDSAPPETIATSEREGRSRNSAAPVTDDGTSAGQEPESSRPTPRFVRRESNSTPDRLLALQTELKELGAQYMVLRVLEGERRRYHFHCRIPVVDGAIYSRPFDASDEDAVRAMERVLAEVQRWRLARSQTEGTRGDEKAIR